MATGESSTQKPFSVFTKREKWALAGIAAFAGFFSALSANIYFPVLPTLAHDFNVRLTLMNLTVTTYMIAQGIAPVFWAPLSDTKGRRPVYIACLSTLVVSCIALALVPTNAWWLLMVFRVFQAAGSASTIALGVGVTSDIAAPAERGGMLGLAILGPMVGPTLGPVLGGLLAGQLGWRWIFWFMCILAAACLICIVLIFPETLRRIVGDGSIPPPWWNRPLVPLIGPNHQIQPTVTLNSPETSIETTISTVVEASPASTVPAPSPPKTNMNIFSLLTQPDIPVILCANALPYAVFSAIPGTTAALFEAAYGDQVNETIIGLCFIPLGVGGMLGLFLTGKGLDWIYKRERRKWESNLEGQQSGKEDEEKGKSGNIAKDEESFHIEKVRLKPVLPYLAVFLGTTIAYGWCVKARGPMAVALIFQFFGGWTTIGVMHSFQTLLIDLFPKQGSSTTALNNLVRCSTGATVISVIDPMLNAIGPGWTFTIICGITAIGTPALTYLEVTHGPTWRAKRIRAQQS